MPLDDRVLQFENDEMPDSLKIGCSHPFALPITRFHDVSARWYCIGPWCQAEWMEVRDGGYREA